MKIVKKKNESVTVPIIAAVYVYEQSQTTCREGKKNDDHHLIDKTSQMGDEKTVG